MRKIKLLLKKPVYEKPFTPKLKINYYACSRKWRTTSKHGRRRAFFQRGVPKAEHGHDFKTLWPRAALHVLLSEVQRAPEPNQARER
jgi:hypothetical protein